ncbi:TetR/AcrR family transcriptional regulator [Nocardioides sp. SYSU D00038]|uniref:TetR/AcrR family transcriptional regulator n=1 Tax=Nocardioides sp. SYSU D00038 TaxID=2812554 RepID=UPI0019687DFD|nr:TetR/AcrR family transcriptional regulator C-terminal domain-containing protein [Nocardioides sp. SYSU D00038]
MTARTRTPATPKERLSRTTVAAAALGMADAEGLDAVTVRRLSATLGVTPMALYWHFKDKDALLDGVVEAILAEVRLAEPDDEAPWDEQLREVLDALVAALAAHPAAADLVRTRVLGSEPGRVLTERVLTLLRRGGFSTERSSQLAVHALLFMIGLVSGLPGQAVGASEEEREQEVRTKWAMLQALPPKRYPHIVESAASLTDCGSSTEWFEVGMDTLMAGIRGQAARG